MIGHIARALGNKGEMTMRTYTEKNGYKWIAIVDSHSAKELMEYGTKALVFVAVPSRPKFAQYIGFSYHVYLRVW